MKFFRKLFMAVLATAALLTIVSCGNQNDWSYSKTDSSDFISFDARCNPTGENSNYVISDLEGLLNSSLDKDDLLLFDLNSALEKSTDYLDYNTIKSTKIDVSSYTYENGTLIVVFDSKDVTSFALLIHKSAVTLDTYLISYSTPVTVTDAIDTNLKFEEEYVENEFTKTDFQNIVNVASALGQLITGIALCATENPTGAVAIVNGAFGLINSIAGVAGSAEPTIKDVLAKLDAIDNRLISIEAKMEQNHTQLLSETIRTQAMIDQTRVDITNQNITAFKTDYEEKLNNIERLYNVEVQQYIKDVINANTPIEIHFTKMGDVYGIVKPCDYTANDVVFTVNPTYTKAKAYLTANKNVIGEGFEEALISDLNEVCTPDILKYATSEKSFSYMAYSTMLNQATAKIYSDQAKQNEVVDLMNKAIGYAKRITGRNGTTPMINTYFERIKYMYNFAGEARSYLTTILAQLRLELDKGVALAQEACSYAGINCSEMMSEYDSAVKSLKSALESEKKLADNYCYVTGSKLEMDLYGSHWTLNYPTTGNKPKFTASFDTYKYSQFNSTTLSYTTSSTDLSKYNLISASDIVRISTRYQLLVELGLSKSANLIDYLAESSVMPAVSYTGYKAAVQRKAISNSDCRFLTGLTIDSLTGDDKGLSLYCYKKGGPKGSDYFSVGSTYKYKEKEESGCWSGKIANGYFVNALNGAIIGNQKFSAYANYDESHWYWSNDEHWAFATQEYKKYFLFYKVA